MEKEIKKIQDSVDIIAKTTAYILENMVTKEDAKSFVTKEDAKSFVTKNDLESFKLEMNINFNNLGSDLKIFKNDTDESTKTTKDDVADLLDTVMIHDKRIEKLENKFV